MWIILLKDENTPHFSRLPRVLVSPTSFSPKSPNFIPMATLQSQLSAISVIGSCCSSSSSSSSTATTSLVSVARRPHSGRKVPYDRRRSLQRSVVRAMVQQAVPGAPAAYAKEMERLSAKESLLLAVSVDNCDFQPN